MLVVLYMERHKVTQPVSLAEKYHRCQPRWSSQLHNFHNITRIMRCTVHENVVLEALFFAFEADLR